MYLLQSWGADVCIRGTQLVTIYQLATVEQAMATGIVTCICCVPCFSLFLLYFAHISVLAWRCLNMSSWWWLCSYKDATKVPKEYLVLGSVCTFVILIFFGVGAGVLCSIVGFVYPSFKSFEAIESKNRGEDIQWLVYWVVFAFFSLIESFIDFLLYWIPFYYAFKLAFLLWAMLPQTKGAKFLYDSFLKDFLKKNESRIDAAMADAKKVSFTWIWIHIFCTR